MISITVLMAYALLSLMLSALYLRQCHGNLGTNINGFGSLKCSLQGKAYMSAQHRMLTPYLWYIVVRTFKMDQVNSLRYAYEPIRFLSILAALIGTHLLAQASVSDSAALGITMITTILIAVSFMFDYTDNMFDLFFMGLFTYVMVGSGNMWILAIVVLLASINRESAGVLPVFYLLFTKDFIGAMVLVIVWASGKHFLLLAYGHKRHYADVMHERGTHECGGVPVNHGKYAIGENLSEIAHSIKPAKNDIWFYNPYLHSAVFVAAVVIGIALNYDNMTAVMQSFALITLFQIVVSLLLACYKEFRTLTFAYPMFAYIVMISI